MKSQSALCDICDVTSPNEYQSCLEFYGKQMSERRAYRDEYGGLIAESPYSWEEVQEKFKHGDIAFGRSVESTRLYRDKMASLAQEWTSVDDYCQHTFLRYDVKTIVHDGGRITKSADTSSPPKATGGMVIVENDFPYNLLPDVQHYVLWAAERFPQTCYSDLVKRRFPSNDYDVIMFENSKEGKSVKSVHHLHLLVREKCSAHAQDSRNIFTLKPKM